MNRIGAKLAAGNLDYLAKHGVVCVRAQDAADGEWEVRLTLAKDGGATIDLTPLNEWTVRVEGVPIGSARAFLPLLAAREALRTAKITRQPEATHVQVGRPGETWIVFTLGGRARSLPLARFRAQVVKSRPWAAARERRRDAHRKLRARLRARGRRPKGPSERPSLDRRPE